MNYPELKTLLETAPYSSLNAVAAVQKLNEATIEYHVPVSSVDIASYLMETPCAAVAPLSLYNCLSLTYRNTAFQPQVQAIAENIIDLATGVDRPISLRGNAQYEAAFQQLVTAGRYTHTEAEGILNLGKHLKSVAQEKFGEPVTIQHITTARRYDEYLQLETERDGLLQQAAQLQGAIDDILAGQEAT